MAPLTRTRSFDCTPGIASTELQNNAFRAQTAHLSRCTAELALPALLAGLVRAQRTLCVLIKNSRAAVSEDLMAANVQTSQSDPAQYQKTASLDHQPGFLDVSERRRKALWLISSKKSR